MIKETLEAIQTAWQASGIQAPLCYDRADGQSFPYIVYTVIADGPKDTFSSTGESLQVQFTAFTEGDDPLAAIALVEQLRDVFDDAAFPVSGAHLVSMKRLPGWRPMIDPDQESGYLYPTRYTLHLTD
jgi:hypothetical protein